MASFDLSAVGGLVGFTWTCDDEIMGTKLTPLEALELGKALLVKSDQAARQQQREDSGPLILMPGIKRIKNP
jgi:hypothetical protein